MRAALGVVGVLAIGCTGRINVSPHDGDAGDQSQIIARQKFESEALPAFQAGGCVTCHDGSMVTTTGAPGYLAGASTNAIHDTIVGSPYVDLAAVPSSRVLVKGKHEGLPLTAQESSAILDWLTAEKLAQGSGGGTGSQLTAKFMPTFCPAGVTDYTMCPLNTVDLEQINIPGVKVTFYAQQLPGAIYITNLTLDASASAVGVYLTHPLFVSYPTAPGADPIPDELDRFATYVADVKPMGAPVVISVNEVFVGFDPANEMSVQFATIGPYDPSKDSGGGGMTGGCKEIQSFVTNAQGPLNASCASCHAAAGNAAMAAMDLTGVDKSFTTDPAAVTTACGQALLQINTDTPANSGFFVDPNPGNATVHPYKFADQANPTNAYNAFAAAVLLWVNDEVTGS